MSGENYLAGRKHLFMKEHIVLEVNVQLPIRRWEIEDFHSVPLPHSDSTLLLIVYIHTVRLMKCSF